MSNYKGQGRGGILKRAKELGIGIIVLQLVGYVLFGLSYYTLFTVMSTTLSGDALMFTSSEDESTGEMTLKVEGDLRNDGFLGADVSLEVRILNSNEEYVASNSTSVYLNRGARHPISITLLIPAEETRRWSSEEDKGFFEFTLGIRTLWDLVGFRNTSKSPVG